MITPTLSLGQDNGNERAKLPVISSSGITQVNGNYTIGSTPGDLPVAGRELFISNDAGSTSMIITVNCLEGTLIWVLLAGETFNERLPLFKSVIVQASGLWRWYIRGNIS